MIKFQFKRNGIQGDLHVTNREVNERLSTYHEEANTHYLVDELTMMVVPDDKQILSFHQFDSGQTPASAQEIANLNGLSDIYISVGGAGYRRLV
ncbi:hypothetical protein L3Q72_14985 [Vibrio sp. JC009]|uniref:hypothetical protein n=1 Tax=Vibrio sp. JC009 TaxID=2912314 RepID=UPI0023AF5083|nr:hypothetical protein [Vibrio sp. JC009]WED24187.1 hypothetical protein L3Q72_14985 [Vibrio sp. JC009]